MKTISRVLTTALDLLLALAASNLVGGLVGAAVALMAGPEAGAAAATIAGVSWFVFVA